MRVKGFVVISEMQNFLKKCYRKFLCSGIDKYPPCASLSHVVVDNVNRSWYFPIEGFENFKYKRYQWIHYFDTAKCSSPNIRINIYIYVFYILILAMQRSSYESVETEQSKYNFYSILRIRIFNCYAIFWLKFIVIYSLGIIVTLQYYAIKNN